MAHDQDKPLKAWSLYRPVTWVTECNIPSMGAVWRDAVGAREIPHPLPVVSSERQTGSNATKSQCCVHGL